ncbi:MAG: acyl-CoA thioesterase [Alloprevotella sp.]
MNKSASLSFTKPLDVRFSEVDAMQIVWHGSYALYFEDAREAFGAHYGLSYHTIADAGYYAPLVDLEFHYRRPIVYGDRPLITITYVPTEAAKLIFDYVITDETDGEVIATGRSVQVFLDSNRNLMWTAPEFYEKWKAATLVQE